MAESSIDDIWKSMKEMDQQSKKEYRKRSDFRHAHSTAPLEIKVKKASKTKKKDGDIVKTKKKVEKMVEDVPESGASAPAAEPDPISSADFLQRHARDVNATDAESSRIRREALTSLYQSLTAHILAAPDANEVLDTLSKPIFKRFADTNEKCRELSLRITESLLASGSDFVPMLPYFIPAVMQRLPAGYMYDEELKIFVSNYEQHDAYKRGRAVDRQDKASGSVTIVEPSEEIRLLLATSILTLLQTVNKYQSHSILHPYFNEIILFTQAQLLDVFPEVKYVACQILLLLCSVDEFELGMKFYAVGLVRALFPVVRHRHARIRAIAVEALESCICIPDRAKRKGAGSDAIVDLVGFREDNVLPIAAFYKSDVQVNYLAELTTDTSAIVREKVVTLVAKLMTSLEDKYDHYTRLLPYLLDFLHDIPSVANIALDCLLVCGKQYEDDHHDEVIEKKQYGVDGDLKINLSKPMLAPFTSRPPMGVRLFVRGNTKRFLIALLNELTNWQSHIRVKSAHLLKTIVFLCEEHLTMEMYTVIPLLVKSYNVACGDNEREVVEVLHEVCELMGRYISPEVYLHFLLPRLAGSAEVTDNVDTSTKCNLLQMMKYFLSGTKESVCVQYLQQVVEVVTDSYVIDFDSLVLQSRALDVLQELLLKCQDKFGAAVEAHYQSTGRLTSLRSVIEAIFGFLLKLLHSSSLNQTAVQCIGLLSKLSISTNSVYALFLAYAPNLLESITMNRRVLYPSSEEFALLQSLICCPYGVVQASTEHLTSLVDYVVHAAITLQQREDTEEEAVLVSHSRLLLSCLAPILSFDESLPSLYVHFYEFAEKRPSTPVPITAGSSLIDRIVEHYVLAPVWLKSEPLAQQRMKLLSLLVTGTTAVTLPQSMSSALFDFSTVFILCHGQQFIDAAIVPSTQPTVIDNLRHHSVLLLQHMFRLFHPRCELEVDLSLQAERRSKFYTSPIPAIGLLHLLSMLNDSYDSIRIDVLIALQFSVDYINFAHKQDHIIGAHVTLPHLWSVLHTKIANGSPTTLFLDYLNDLLRSLAVVDPQLMESLVRSALPTASQDEITVYSGLIDHCGLLCDLQQLKKTEK